MSMCVSELATKDVTCLLSSDSWDRPQPPITFMEKLYLIQDAYTAPTLCFVFVKGCPYIDRLQFKRGNEGKLRERIVLPL